MKDFIWKFGTLKTSPRFTLLLTEKAPYGEVFMYNGSFYVAHYLGNNNYRIFEGRDAEILIMAAYLPKCDPVSACRASVSAIWDAAVEWFLTVTSDGILNRFAIVDNSLVQDGATHASWDSDYFRRSETVMATANEFWTRMFAGKTACEYDKLNNYISFMSIVQNV